MSAKPSTRQPAPRRAGCDLGPLYRVAREPDPDDPDLRAALAVLGLALV